MKGNIQIFIRVSVFLLIVMLMTGCGKNASKVETIRKVSVTEIGAASHKDNITLSGNVTPMETVNMSFKLDGKIANVYVEEGGFVKKGQKIAGLEPRDYSLQARAAFADQSTAQAGVGASQAQYDAAQAQYEAAKIQAETEIPSKINQAKAQLDLTQVTYDRVQKLFEAEAASRSQLDEITAKLKADTETYQQALDAESVANAQLQAAQLEVQAYASQISASTAQLDKANVAASKADQDLKDTTIETPINGVILKKIMNTGEIVSAGYPVVAIGRIEKVYIEIGVSDQHINALQKGQDAQVSVYGMTGVLSGKIAEIASLADSQTRTFPVKILVDNPSGNLKPGMIANATLQTGTQKVILIPLDSVLQRSDGSVVYIYDATNQKVSVRKVITGDILGDCVEVTAGLQTGDQLVTDGQFLLHDGDTVHLEEEETE